MSYKGGREPSKQEEVFSRVDHAALQHAAQAGHPESHAMGVGQVAAPDQLNALGPGAANIGSVRFR